MKNFSSVRFSLIFLASLTALGCGKVITLGGSTSQVSNLLTAFPLLCKAYDLTPMEMTSLPVHASAIGGPFPSMIPPAPYSTYLGSFSISHFNLPAMDENLGIPGTPDTFRKLVNNFAISCEAKLKVESDGDYAFLTINDSATYVTVDGEFVNPHPVMMGGYSQGGMVSLMAGMHTFRLEYLRSRCVECVEGRSTARVASVLPGPGQIALQLFWGSASNPSPTPTPTFSPTSNVGIQWAMPVMTIPANTQIIPPPAFVAN